MTVDLRQQAALPSAAAPGLRHLPLPLFAVPMGLGGLGLAWREAAVVLDAPEAVGEGVLAVMALAWLLIAALHGLRAARHGDAVLAELRHPVRASFGGAPTIGVMLLAAGIAPYAEGAAAMLWCVAVPLHLGAAVVLLRRMLGGRAEAAMLAPPLLIPMVGNILAPVIGARLGFPVLSWMMFGVGLFLWLALQPLLLHRLVAGPPIPQALRPSVAILIAPPAVGCLALYALQGEVTPPALALFGLAVLVAAVVAAMIGDFARLSFSLVWWSFTFPTAAFAIALMVTSPATGLPAPALWAALLAVTAIVLMVAWRTLQAAWRGAFLRPEH